MAAQKEAEEKERRKAEEEKERKRRLFERRETEEQKQQVMERLAPCPAADARLPARGGRPLDLGRLWDADQRPARDPPLEGPSHH